MSSSLEPSVYIIESLRFEDERARRLEGRILRSILKLSEKKAVYTYIRTRKELKAVLRHFSAAGMRYLHISCHGSQSSIHLTLDSIPFEEFGQLVKPHLNDRRRLFFSACEVVNEELAKAVMGDSCCWSIVGPDTPVTFGDAALMWASFYHLVFRENPEGMNREQIKSALVRIHRAFSVRFTYFTHCDHAPYFQRVLVP